MTTSYLTLDDHLHQWSADDSGRRQVAETIAAIAAASAELSALIRRGPFVGDLDSVIGDNAGGDPQKQLDVRANELFFSALQRAPVGVFASEESDSARVLDEAASLAVAIDPLDGSSNIDTNISVGSIFSVLPNPGVEEHPDHAFLQPGSRQLAAGFSIYGPQTSLVLTVGAGTHVFTLDPMDRRFKLTRGDVKILEGRREYAINASNYRHWDKPLRDYIDDLVAGSEGPRGEDFNMRWIASLVAEAYRIVARGGIFLYPRDSRRGYERGRLRLVYEANPIALIIEQAGGASTDAIERILDKVPRELHERTPLVFGARAKVERVARYHTAPPSVGETSPLFGRRGLFRL